MTRTMGNYSFKDDCALMRDTALTEAKHWGRMALEAGAGIDFDPEYYTEQRDTCRARACAYLRIAKRYAEEAR